MVITCSYIGGYNVGDTIENTFLMHSSSVNALAELVAEANAPTISLTGLPYVIDEAGSLLPIGVQGLTNTFGAGLWTADYSLWAAVSLCLFQEFQVFNY